MYYNVPVTVSKQEDGLWRAEVPGIQGCWVDEPTLAKALHEIHEVFALFADVLLEEGRPFPDGVTVSDDLPLSATIPVTLSEHKIRRYPIGAKRARRVAKSPALRTRIPRHSDEIPNGTLHSILADLGLTLDDLRNA